MPGLAWGAERSDARLVGGIDVARPFLISGTLRARLRAGSAANTWDDLRERGAWVAGAALEGVWGFPFGSILIGAGVNTRREHRLDVSLGAVF
jgi:hypothetical protein